MKMKKGFTLVELLIIIAILVIFLVVVLVSISRSKEKTYYARAIAEFKTMSTGLLLYRADNGTYPGDVSRDIPPGIGKYLAGYASSTWPDAPWPGSVYDWDNWDDPTNPGKKIYQISIRFCPVGGPLSACQFPQETWAANFGVDSSVYYCVSGSCRANINQPTTYPGYCVNCAAQPAP